MWLRRRVVGGLYRGENAVQAVLLYDARNTASRFTGGEPQDDVLTLREGTQERSGTREHRLTDSRRQAQGRASLAEGAHDFIPSRLALIGSEGSNRLAHREAYDTQNIAALRRCKTGALESKLHRFGNNVLAVGKCTVAIENDKKWCRGHFPPISRFRLAPRHLIHALDVPHINDTETISTDFTQ